MEVLTGLLKSLGIDPEEAINLMNQLLNELYTIHKISEENNRIGRFILRRIMAIEEWEEEQIRGGQLILPSKEDEKNESRET